MKKALIFILFLTVITSPLLAWGEKGHTIVNEAATFGVPAEMPSFFHAAYPRLVWLGYDPDRWRGAGPSMDAVNPPEHFLDYEYVEHLELPPDRFAYVHLLYESGTLERFGIGNTTAGFLPWRAAELMELITDNWREWRRTPDGAGRQQLEETIVFLSGVLGHYIADAANPHHTTINYNGWVQPNPEGFANDCDTHSRFETRFVSRRLSVDDVHPRLAPPQIRTDYFATALGHVRDSNRFVRELYRIDRDGGFEGKGTPESFDFTATRLAAGASLLRDLWWSAWVNSAKPPARR